MVARPPSSVRLLRRVLVVDDDAGALQQLTQLCEREGLEATAASSLAVAQRELTARPFELVIADARSGAALLPSLASPLLVHAPAGDAAALELLEAGAWGRLPAPARAPELRAALRALEERERLRREVGRFRRGPTPAAANADASVGNPGGAAAPPAVSDLGGRILSRAPAMADIVRAVSRYAAHKQTVLVLGESGTGKELVARALHDSGPRAAGPFIPVLCGAIPEALIESELFGHKKGSFTDATRDKLGLFEAATGGTLFLDEVGELPLTVQVKLLRALQEEHIRRLGDVTDIAIDVRVVAATMRDLPAEVAAGRFREDLYYRLNVLSIQLPPLRERTGDLPVLVDGLIARHAARLGLPPPTVSDDAMAIINAYPWPGNVRELENTIERALVLCDGDVIDTEVLPDRLRARGAAAAADASAGAGSPGGIPAMTAGDLSIKKTSRAMEKELIRRALAKTQGNRTNAAKILEISHRALLYKIKEYGLG
ncbi:MAG: sigma 54-interacting transcriptional regulator [Deltaproteobacteria bacterium]|nr:sigma 54-interacting transcriptional regulator [Deltaproteobacteria bacterium]